MRILSWNINSVRLRLPLLLTIAEQLQPEVMALQELKAETALFPAAALAAAGYVHQQVCGQKGYNGVAIVSRQPLEGLPGPDWCGKGDARHVAVRHASGIVIHNFYIPAGGDIPDPAVNPKFAHKLQFMDELQNWQAFQTGEKAILLGDLNIAPLPEDVWSHRQLLDVVSHTPIEVKKLTGLQQRSGWVDTHRLLTPPPARLYSWWSYRAKDWGASNRGRRLDHIWASPALAPQLTGAGIFTEPRSWNQPSDHVPIWADFSV